MNTANKITMIRVILVPIFMVLLMIDNALCQYLSLGVFVLASVTDAIDGHIARKYNQVTTFGKFVDPLADKVLTTSAFLILMHYDRMSVWALMIVLVREFAVSGIRLVAAGDGKIVAASMWGKLKTVSQMIAIIVAILLLNTNTIIGIKSYIISDILIWISILFTLISGIDYIAKNWNLLKMK